MQRNVGWPIFLSIVSIMLVVFASLLSLDLYRYRKLSNSTYLTEKEGRVIHNGSDRYKVELEYAYEISGQRFHRQEILKNKKYKNVWLANQAIDSFVENESIVWFNPKEPHKASLCKTFPYKRLFSTIVLLGIFFYFCLLSSYMLRRV